jgi:hypothetical protein
MWHGRVAALVSMVITKEGVGATMVVVAISKEAGLPPPHSAMIVA